MVPGRRRRCLGTIGSSGCGARDGRTNHTRSPLISGSVTRPVQVSSLRVRPVKGDRHGRSLRRTSSMVRVPSVLILYSSWTPAHPCPRHPVDPRDMFSRPGGGRKRVVGPVTGFVSDTDPTQPDAIRLFVDPSGCFLDVSYQSISTGRS